MNFFLNKKKKINKIKKKSAPMKMETPTRMCRQSNVFAFYSG